MSRLPRLSLRLLLVAACAAPLAAFPNGAPTEACIRGMSPNHRHFRAQDPSTMPFSITRQTTRDGVRVTIQPLSQGSFFKGFMIQARDPTTGKWAKSLGSWQPVDNVNQLNECSSLTHADRSEKASVAVTWTGSPDVTMHATIVENFGTFWANMTVPEGRGAPQPTRQQQQQFAPRNPQQQQQQRPQRQSQFATLRQGVVTNRPFQQQQFAPVVDQRHFNVQEFFRQ